VSSGATQIFVFPSHAPTGLPRGDHGAAALLTYAYRQVLGRWTVDRSWAEPTVAVEVLPVPPLGGANPFDFSAGRRLIDSASRLTEAWLVERDRRAA
jgi:hypothetical protein